MHHLEFKVESTFSPTHLFLIELRMLKPQTSRYIIQHTQLLSVLSVVRIFESELNLATVIGRILVAATLVVSPQMVLLFVVKCHHIIKKNTTFHFCFIFMIEL